MPYYLLLTSLLTAKLFTRDLRLNRLVFYAFCLLLLLFIGYRFEVGCDWFSYSRYANMRYTGFVDAATQRDPFFHLSGYFIRELGLAYYPAINVICASVFMLGVFTLGRNLPDPMSFLVYLYPVAIIGLAMSGIRQAAALGVLMVAFHALLMRRYVPFAAIVALAAGFHASALIFMLAIPLFLDISARAKAFFLLVLGALLLAVVSQTESADIAMDRYLNSGIESTGALFRLGFLGLCFGMYWLFLRKQLRAIQSPVAALADIGLLITAFLMLVAVAPVGGLSPVVADRLGLYLWPIIGVTLAGGPFALDNAMRLRLVFLSSGLFTVFFLAWSLVGNKFDSCYSPYQSYLF